MYVLLVRVSFISSAHPEGAAAAVAGTAWADGLAEFLVAEEVALVEFFLGSAVVPDLGTLFSG